MTSPTCSLYEGRFSAAGASGWAATGGVGWLGGLVQPARAQARPSPATPPRRRHAAGRRIGACDDSLEEPMFMADLQVKTLSRRVRCPSVGISRPNKRDRGYEDDVNVQDQRPVVDVVEIVVDTIHDLVQRVCFTTPAVDLCPAGDPRLYLVAKGVVAHDILLESAVG